MGNKTKHITENEWCYLTPKAKALVKKLQVGGVEDADLAVELAVLMLGEREAYELE